MDPIQEFTKLHEADPIQDFEEGSSKRVATSPPPSEAKQSQLTKRPRLLNPEFSARRPIPELVRNTRLQIPRNPPALPSDLTASVSARDGGPSPAAVTRVTRSATRAASNSGSSVSGKSTRPQ